MGSVPVLVPTISGLISGILVYGTCRSFDVAPGKSAGIAAVVGLMTTIGQMASSWLRVQAADATLQLPSGTLGG
jgi:hypothetical protein